jgi:Fe-S-cluster containining protein
VTQQSFACTACGRCCSGSLPINVAESLKRADMFPLAMSLMPIQPSIRGHSIIKTIGATVVLSKRQTVSLIVTPTSFIPNTLPCPQLTDNGLCMIHDDKPLRCRTMPFYPYKDEDSQADMLVPRAGWLCETGEMAPTVYRDRQIVDRTDFDSEQKVLVDQAPALQRFVDLLLQHNPPLRAQIAQASQARIPRRVVVGFLSYVRYDRRLDLIDYARRQYPVLEIWVGKTRGDPKFREFHAFYRQAMSDLEPYRT